MSKADPLLLIILAVCAGLMLSIVDSLTRERIALSEQRVAQGGLLDMIPPEYHGNNLSLDPHPIPRGYWSRLGLPRGGDIHIARRDDRPVAVIIPSLTPHGYSGDIAMIVAVHLNGTIGAVRVVDHGETLGLGDSIELAKSNWILGFDHKSLSNPEEAAWEVKKNGGHFDQITGATITSQAVIYQVANTLRYFNSNSEHLLISAQSKTGNHTVQTE